jgi:hypothetical protein
MDFQGPGFTLTVPSEWLIQAAPAIQAIFLSPDGSQTLRANLVITLRPLQPEVTLLDIGEISRQAQQKEYTGYALENETPIKSGDIDGIERQYRWFDEQQNIWIAQSQRFFVHEQVLYTLTTTCSPNDHEVYKPIFGEMLTSFRFRE